MITKVFSIHDGKAKMFGVPFYMLTTGMAIRAFEDLCKEKMSMVAKHPEDFVLYEIGQFDDNTAETNNHTPIIYVASGTEFASPKYIQPIMPPVETNEKEKVK